ncbi:MAG: hypothetical protein PUE13_03500 [Clostridiales bacterium]|nr:hypothetical protein [Clostridiales bacterium]
MDNILRAEAERTGHCGNDEVTVPECPCFGGDTWEYLPGDVSGRIAGCGDCVVQAMSGTAQALCYSTGIKFRFELFTGKSIASVTVKYHTLLSISVISDRFTIQQHYNCILADLYNIYEISKIILQKDIKCVIIKLLNAKLKRES